jgi:corrinoid protein of di/trimethylamine methyltransferase
MRILALSVHSVNGKPLLEIASSLRAALVVGPRRIQVRPAHPEDTRVIAITDSICAARQHEPEVSMTKDKFSAMRQSIIDGAPDTAFTLAQEALADGVAPLDAVNSGYVPGMHDVGEQFARRQMFLPDMMASAAAMRAAMAVLDPELKKLGTERQMAGVVVLGTTKGDIHEIGKLLVGTMLSANGFHVHDLGADVSAEKFAAKAQELNADIVGVSALLTTTMRNQREVVKALTAAGLRPQVKIIVGGAPVTRQWAEEIGADGYAKDAMTAVGLALSLMEQNAARGMRPA